MKIAGKSWKCSRPEKSPPTKPTAFSPRWKLNYLRVVVDAIDPSDGDGPTKVNVRIPMQLLRAGVRLAGLIPSQALSKANEALRDKGIPIDLSHVKPENLEELLEQLQDLTVDVDAQEKGEKMNVRVFCE